MKKLLTAQILIFFTINGYALTINPTLDADILAIKDGGMDIAYKIFSLQNGQYKTDEMTIGALPIHYFKEFFDGFNEEKASFVPTNSIDGKPSTISFGYVENQKSVYPPSCQFIQVKPILNIKISKKGCLIS